MNELNEFLKRIEIQLNKNSAIPNNYTIELNENNAFTVKSKSNEDSQVGLMSFKVEDGWQNNESQKDEIVHQCALMATAQYLNLNFKTINDFWDDVCGEYIMTVPEMESMSKFKVSELANIYLEQVAFSKLYNENYSEEVVDYINNAIRIDINTANLDDKEIIGSFETSFVLHSNETTIYNVTQQLNVGVYKHAKLEEQIENVIEDMAVYLENEYLPVLNKIQETSCTPTP